MAIRVNPPPQKIPPGLAQRDPELFKYLEDTQFQQYQMWRLTVNIGDSSNNLISTALTAKLQQQIGSGQFLTCDDTGFTCDNDHFTCDMTEA